MIKRTSKTAQPARSAIRIGALLALVYLGNKVYIGTLPWWELAPAGKTQMADGNAASTIAAFAGWGGLALMVAALYFVGLRDLRTSDKEFEAAIPERHITSSFLRVQKGWLQHSKFTNFLFTTLSKIPLFGPQLLPA